MVEYSFSPTGERFQLPAKEDGEKEFQRLKKIVKRQRDLAGRLWWSWEFGFVGAVMAAVIADSKGKNGNSKKFVIGMQRPSSRSYWKIPLLNRGLPPVSSEDPEVPEMIHRCVNEKKTLIATYTYDALKLADVVVVDVQCDYLKESLGNVRNGLADIAALENSLEVIAQNIAPETLVLIETTVAPGTTEQVAYPIYEKGVQETRTFE